MTTKRSRINRKTHLKDRFIGKKARNRSISISEPGTDFFEDIPLYRSDKVKPVRKLGKIHLARSRKSKSTKA